MAHWRVRAKSSPLLIALVVCAATLSRAQHGVSGGESSNQRKAAVNVAELKGRVTAVSGRSVSGAAVLLEDLHTHSRKTAKSFADGTFDFAGLPAGEYRLEVTAFGYRTFAVATLPLVAGDSARAIAVLVPGDAADVMTGSKESVTSRLGTALAGKSVSDLPENQRNFVSLVQVSAGANEGSANANASGSRPGAQHDSSAVSIGGQPETTNYHQIDGIDNNERINSQIAVHPSVEGIDAVQVFASAYSASLGQAGGGVVNVQTKSGADAIHGSAYEYFRNDVLDAFPFQFGAKNAKPELRQNQFGASLGGPFVRNRAYYFGDYEGFRLVQGRAPVELTVPTAWEHAHPGDFSDAGGPALKQIDPAGLAYFKLYPLPNVAGSADQFVSAPSGTNFAQTGDLRIDPRFSDRDRFFSRFSYNRTLVYIPGQFPAVEDRGMIIRPGGSLTSFAGNMYDLGFNTVVDWTHEFRSNLVLDLRAGNVYWHERDTGLNPSVAVNQAFGQPGINLASTSNGLAPVNVLAASPLGTDGFWRPIDQSDSTFQYGAALTWSQGAHSLATGATLIRRNWDDSGSGAGLGTWNVLDLPSLLEGQFLQVKREVDLVDWHIRSWEASGYFQDTWKPASHLNLNLGLRYDVFTPPTEQRNRISNFDAATGRIVVADQDGGSRTAGVRTDYGSIGPRFGFTLGIDNQTTVRGGLGIVYFRPLDGFVYEIAPFAYTFGSCSSATCPAGYTSLAAGLPEPAAPDYHSPAGDIPYGARSFGERMSAMLQINLGVERQFAGNTLTAFYVGTLGRRQARYFPDLNAPPPNTATDPNSLRPYHAVDPNLADIGYVDTEGSSSYHALQVTFSHELRHGLTAHINYSGAHSLDDNTGQGFGTVPALSSVIDYGNSSFDVRQRAAATLFYELPLGKRHRSSVVLRGWQLNLSGVWSTGLPYTVLNANDVSNTNPGASLADRPDQVGNPRVGHPGVSQYFNVNAFRAQPQGTLGTERSNQLQGPPVRHIDISLFKNFTLRKEATLQFRTEVFNLTNTANFASPSAVLGGANFGRLTQLTAGYTPREIQFALRLRF